MIQGENQQEEKKPDYIGELYADSDPAKVRQDLLKERNDLDPSDPFTTHEWQRLTYLIAKSYEMEGNSEEAIKNYLAVIQDQTQTLWGNLAAIHLANRPR